MKWLKKALIWILFTIVLISVFLWWQQYKQDKELMDSLKLHQPIEISEIDTVVVWKSQEEPKEVRKEEVKKIIKGFNDSEPGEEKGDFYDLPTHEAGIIIDLKKGHKIRIYYVKGMIDVIRTDVKPNMEVSYNLKTIEPKLKDYFEKLVD